MKLIDAQKKLLEMKQSLVTTSDVSSILKISRSYASKVMVRLEQSSFSTQVARGKWVIQKDVDPFIVPEFLAAPSLSYISLQSALFYHGMISQIPEIIYSVTTGRAHRYTTEIGVFSLHHLEAEFFFGFESIGNSGIKMASPEKALLDLFYFIPSRSRLFQQLPEVELEKNFSFRRAFEMLHSIRSKSRQTIVRKALESLIADSK